MDLYSIYINNWEQYQPRKDLTKLSWFRVDTNLFNGQTYFLLKNNGLVVFLFMLSLAAEKNNSDVFISLEFAADKLKLKKDEIISALKILESLQLVHSSVRICTDLSPTIRTNDTNDTNDTIRTNERYDTLDFESAYILYPLKKGKSLGLKKLSKDIKTENDLALFKSSIVNYKKDLEINKTDAKYIKHFSTFCNEWKDWVDYVPIVLELNKSKEQRVFDTAREQLARIERGEL